MAPVGRSATGYLRPCSASLFMTTARNSLRHPRPCGSSRCEVPPFTYASETSPIWRRPRGIADGLGATLRRRGRPTRGSLCSVKRLGNEQSFAGRTACSAPRPWSCPGSRDAQRPPGVTLGIWLWGCEKLPPVVRRCCGLSGGRAEDRVAFIAIILWRRSVGSRLGDRFGDQVPSFGSRCFT
jgi:hypothetical protein